MNRKKLIEVAIPLEKINEHSGEKNAIRKGHPMSLHSWWARRPLAACRAVLFSQIVDDPASVPEEFPTESAQVAERQRLFGLIEELVTWEGALSREVIGRAQWEMARSIARAYSLELPTKGDETAIKTFLADHGPSVVDPFAGGGSIPLEARRLGLPSVAIDINPLAAAINRILADADVRKGETQLRQLKSEIAKLEPQVRKLYRFSVGGLTSAQSEAAAFYRVWFGICANPACGKEFPLTNGMQLGSKPDAFLVIEAAGEGWKAMIRSETPPDELSGKCIHCPKNHVAKELRELAKGQGLKDRRVVAILKGRSPTFHGLTSESPESVDQVDGLHPAGPIPEKALGIRVRNYGITEYYQLLNPTQRHVVSLLISSANGWPTVRRVLLWLVLQRLIDYYCILTYLDARSTRVQKATGPPTMQMRLGYVEINPFGSMSGNIPDALERVSEGLDAIVPGPHIVICADSATVRLPAATLVSTDPPYYDMIGYGALSDQFYVWARQLLVDYVPEFNFVLSPKDGELIAEPGRHASPAAAGEFFENGLVRIFKEISAAASEEFPLTIYYSYKQKDSGLGANAWESLLGALLQTGYQITATWPMETEIKGGLRVEKRGALASCIVLVVRQRARNAAVATRQDFVKALKAEMPKGIKRLYEANIAPVDLAQAAIGPGMAVFSRYAKVVEASGQSMPVRTALQLINQVLDEIQAEQESEFDSETRWAIAWFEQVGMGIGLFGDAETLSKAKNTAVSGLVEAGLLDSKQGKVRLLTRAEMPPDYDPTKDQRVTVWEVAQHLIKRLLEQGEPAAGDLAAKAGGLAEVAKDLAYRLYTTCERKGWSQEAIPYNALVTAWPEISRLASGAGKKQGLEAFA
jgi:putative DNA methylase